jgi:antitoxin component of MazEF toxin-antitoxin module
MLRTKQKVDAQGVHIPLPFVEQYGLSPGTEVIVEFGPDGIFLSPATVNAEKIETQALRLLFRKLGDAIKVRVQQDQEIAGLCNPWRVDVYGSDAKLLLGHLLYTADGEFLPESSTSFASMRQKAIESALVG